MRADEPETKTITVKAGRLQAAAYRQTLERYAVEQGLACEVQERRRLLTIVLVFTVSGTQRQVRAFEKSVPSSTPMADGSKLIGGG